MSKSEAVARAEIDASIHQADTGMASTVPRATGGEVQGARFGPPCGSRELPRAAGREDAVQHATFQPKRVPASAGQN
jgi:hypothetical protein